jgi:hypothetical protein
MSDSPHIDSTRFVDFLSGDGELGSTEEEHVLGCDDCMNAAVNELLKRNEDESC